MAADRPVAIVTGGTRGIGLGIARALAGEGCDLAVCGRRPADQVTETVTALGALGTEVLYVSCDVSVAADRAKLIEAVRTRFGHLNVLVNNAGVAPDERADILDASEESFARLIRINLQGPYFLTQAVARWMIAQRQATGEFRGCIINVSSISAYVASVNRGDYCISKAGIGMATKLWAARLGEFGIPVYEMRPGITATDMTAGVKEKYDKLIAEGLCVQSRWGTPEDCGKAAACLVRGDLPYSTGQVIDVDGGLGLLRL